MRARKLRGHHVSAGQPRPVGHMSLSRHLAVGAIAATIGARLINPIAGAWIQPSHAQQGPRVAIDVAPVTQAEPASRTRFLIQIAPPLAAVGTNSFLRIRGLPPTAALTEGHVIAPGSWAVPLAALPSLAVILPIGLSGQSDVGISLVTVDGNVLAEAKTMLVVAAPPSTGNAARVFRAPPPLPRAEEERALALHTKGEDQLSRGSIYAARQFFERAAAMGLPKSALALAQTYDPAELAKLRILGLQPDPAAARKWYERARELGVAEAEERLRRLDGW